MYAIKYFSHINEMPMKEQMKLCDITLQLCKQKEVEIQNGYVVQSMQKKVTNGTHTLRHVLVSKPGGRFPVRVGSIYKNKNVINKEKKKKKEKKEKSKDM
jgi:hypothetical protein